MAASPACGFFLLGLASGLCALPAAAYERVSPRWLKWLLVGLAGVVASRYIVAAIVTPPGALPQWEGFHGLWSAGSAGLTIPGVFAVDQLIRHPAISARRLALWCSPLFGLYVLTALLGPSGPRLLSVVQVLFAIAFLAGALYVGRKVPSRLIRLALAALALAYGALALDPGLASEMATLLALWFGYRTAARLQQPS